MMSRHSRRSGSPPGPFSPLKGPAVSGQKDGEQARERSEEDQLFLAEMANQGICPTQPAPRAQGRKRGEEDASLFLAALEEVAPPSEKQVDGEGGRRYRGSRRRRLARGEIVPGDKLDLHGLHRGPALEKLGWFLERTAAAGEEAVLIITGRGRGSEGEPVLGGAVQESLEKKHRGLVLEWCRAPRRLGGDGALVVFLRSR